MTPDPGPSRAGHPRPPIMRQNAANVALFVLLAAGLTAGWWYVDTNFIPKP